MNYKLASFVLNSGTKKQTINEVFIAQPDTNKEALAGRAFIMIEIDAAKTDSIKIIDFLINNFTNNYYQNEKIQLRERIETLKVEHIFESALAKTNKSFADFIENEKIKISGNEINAVIGVAYENELYYSACGKNKSLLIFNEKNSSKSNQSTNMPRLVDVGRAAGDKADPLVDINKLFSNVISGKIPPAGYFLFTNEAFPEYLSGKQIIEIITKLPPTGAAEQIKTVLSGINSYVSFLGIIIKNTLGVPQSEPVDKNKLNIPAKYRSDESSATQSVSGLKNTADKTERMLSPSGSINFGKYLNFFGGLLSKINPLNNSKIKLPKLSIKDKIFVQKKPSFISVKKAGLFISRLFLSIFALAFSFLKFFTRKENIKTLGFKIKTTFIKIGATLKKFWQQIISMSRLNKLLFVVFVVCIVILVYNIRKTEETNEVIERQEVAREIIDEIKVKQNKVDAHLLYNNEGKAKEVLNELKDLLNTLPRDTEDQNASFSELFSKHTEQLAKIQHFEIIDNPTKLADFVNLNNQANPGSIIILDNRIIAGDGGNKSAYVYNFDNNTTTQLANLSPEIFAMDHPSISSNDEIYYLNNSSIAKLNLGTESVSLHNIELTSDRGKIADIETYSNRVYTLDTAKNQIYRYDRSDSTYETASGWLSDDLDLANASDIYIDGNIYILFKDGVIKKFFGGEEEDYKVDTVEPKLTKADKLIVNEEEEDDYVYVLEKATNRIVVFSYEGEFLLQYKSGVLNNIKDFTVDPDNKKIYVLNNSKLYQFDFKH